MTKDITLIWSPTELLLMSIGAFGLCFCVIWLVKPLAVKIGLTDNPDSRKQHVGSIPLVGGIGVSVAVAASLVLSGGLAFPQTHVLLMIGGILVLLGLLDDYSEIRPRYRLLVELAVGLALFFYAGIQIITVGDIAGTGTVMFSGGVAVLFTVMCSVGVFNSINMIDGLDGLAGTIVSLSAGSMAAIAYASGDLYSAGVLLVIVATLLSFLVFNLNILGSSNKVFLGDSGSMFLGFILLWFFIDLSQGERAPMSPVVAGWIFGLPLADTVSVIVGRFIRGESPLAAGRDHVHYRLLAKGFSARKVLGILSVYHLFFVCIGVVGNQFTDFEPFLFAGFVILTISHFSVLKLLFPYPPVSSDEKAESSRI